MIQLFHNFNGVNTAVDKPENGTWVNILPPFKQEEFTEFSEKLDIPLYDIPGNVPSSGTRMPQGLYNKLQEMKVSGHPEAKNINIGFQKGWVARSTGPCN